MTPTVPIGLIGLVLSVAPSWAGDFSAELDFLTRASNSNLFAIEESRLALDRTRAPQLKTFARGLVEDHGSAETEFQAAAKGSGATAPTILDQDHQARLTALRRKSGVDFDKTYIADQVEDHSNALTLYGDHMLWGEFEKLHVGNQDDPRHGGAAQAGPGPRRGLMSNGGPGRLRIKPLA